MPTGPDDKTVIGGEPVPRTVLRLGRYALKQRLGVGGMAEVYLAEQDGPQRFTKKVVVKRILPSLAADPGFVAMFVREAQVAARLSHGNVVQIYELGEHKNDDGTVEYFIAMEYIDGLTLQRLASASWQAGRAIPIEVVLRTCADAARGLHAAHTLVDDNGRPISLVHRDISPDNLMVSRDGVTKVLDFGIAKGESLDGPKTRTGQLRGKVPYMAPEQVSGQPLDGRCDLWALGVSMYWLLCGERPFDRNSDYHTMAAIIQEAPKPPTQLNPGIPPTLEQLILRCLQKDRALRPATGDEIADVLEELTPPGTGAGRRSTVSFLEKFLASAASKGAGNPLSEAGDKTSNTRPMGGNTLDGQPAVPRNVTLPSGSDAQQQQHQEHQQEQRILVTEEATRAPSAQPTTAGDALMPATSVAELPPVGSTMGAPVVAAAGGAAVAVPERHKEPSKHASRIDAAALVTNPAPPQPQPAPPAAAEPATNAGDKPPPPQAQPAQPQPVPPLAESAEAGVAAASESSPVKPVKPATPLTVSSSGNHPVVDMLAPPRQGSALPALLVVGALVVVVGGLAFAGWKLVSVFGAGAGDDTGDVGTRVADAGAGGPVALPPVVDAGTKPPAVVDAGSVTAPPPVVDAGSVTAPPPVVDAGTKPSVVDAGVAAPPPSNRWFITTKAPKRIEWRLENDALVGRGSTTLNLAKGTARVVAVDDERRFSVTMPVTNGKALDYNALPSGKIAPKQVEGTKIFIGHELTVGNAPISVVAGTYTVRVTKGTKILSKKAVVVKPGETVVVDAAKP